MRHGLVIGKFYPPHRGHAYLIESALGQSDAVDVLVCHRQGQTIPGGLRAAWLREMTPRARVRVIDDCVPEDDSQGWAEYTRKILGQTPDVVFSSENYGVRYSDYLGCEHVLVDSERTTVPISGSRIRQAPLRCWEYLPDCVRGYYAVRVCVLGAESTGTTTMAQALADHYNTCWCPEFGRMYWEACMHLSNHSWNDRDFGFIAQEQNRMEDELARRCNRILVSDTDSFATRIWQERYMGAIATEVEALSSDRSCALYLLTHTDLPFVQDGTRDGEQIRHWMHGRFLEELARTARPYVVVSGNLERRMSQAVAAVDQIADGWRGPA